MAAGRSTPIQASAWTPLFNPRSIRTATVADVFAQPNPGVTACFVYTDTGLSVDFDASCSTTDEGTIDQYLWNFGDGTSTTTSSPTINHVFPGPGSYNVTLQVRNTYGAWSFPVVEPFEFHLLDLAIMALNPLGYWKLNEPGGATSAIDYSGNNRPGSYSGGTLALIAGPDGRTYWNPGTNTGRVILSDDNDWSLDAAGRTFFCLTYGAGSANNRYLALKSSGTAPEWGWRFGLSNVMQGLIWNSSGGSYAGTAHGSVITGDEWTLRAWTVPAGGLSVDMATEIYQNSATDIGTPTVGGSGVYVNGSAVMSIGGSGSTNSSWGEAIAHFAVLPPLGPTELQSLVTAAQAAGWIP